MGFGTLFIGYFLLLDLPYYMLTDMIAAAVMLLGLYKLSGVNRAFKTSFIITGVFLVFSLYEMGASVIEMFSGELLTDLARSLTSIVRCLLVGSLTVFMLRGIEDVAREVELPLLSKKAHGSVLFTFIIYSLWIILELPPSFIQSLVGDYILAVASLIAMLSLIALIISNLTVIYSSYMRICMPGDEDRGRERPSRFAIVNEFRRRQEEREAERKREAYEALKRKQEKKKNGKK